MGGRKQRCHRPRLELCEHRRPAGPNRVEDRDDVVHLLLEGGAPRTGSDIPVPRRSNVIRRENDARRRNIRATDGSSHTCSTAQIHVGTQRRSTGPSPITW